MSNYYLGRFTFMQTKFLQGITLAIVLVSMQISINGQSVWNGSLSSDVLTNNNWTPAITITGTATTSGPHIAIPRTPVKPGNLLYDHPPVLTGAANFAVRSMGGATVPNIIGTNDSVDLDGNGTKETFLSNSKFIVNLNEGFVFTVQNGTTSTANANWYPGGTIIVNSGKLQTGRPVYLTADSQTLIVQNKGIFQCNNLVMGSDNSYLTATYGGRIIAKDNGKFIFGPWNGRTTSKSKGPQIFISENATIEFSGTSTDFNTLIKDGKLVGGPGYYPVTKYDAPNTKVYIWAVPDYELLISQTDIQILSAGENGKLISVVTNQAYKDCDPSSFQWKYSLTPGGPYLPLPSPVLDDSLKVPNFSISGTLYVVCQANKISDGSTLTTNEVKFVVGSVKLSFNPTATQYIRVGQLGATITATETGTSTAREWKYSRNSGGPYQSFAIPETGITYTPNFAEADTFYVQFESTIDGNVERGREIMVICELWTASARTITWLGTSSEVTNALNWNPIAHIHRNNLTIPFAGIINMPKIVNSGKDTINTISINGGATFTIAKPSLSDTLNIRGDNFLGDGNLIIESGVVHSNNTMRLTTDAGLITVKGTGSLLFRGTGFGMSLGNDDAVTFGGQLLVEGDGLVKHDVGPHRISTNAANAKSRTTIKDNGQIWYKGDQYKTIYNWIKLNKLFQDTSKTDTLAFLYEAVSNYTRVWAIDTLAPCVAPLNRIYAGKDQPIQLSARNAANLNSIEWLYRKNVNDGKVFELPEAWTTIQGVNGTDVSVSFSEIGDYFVTWVAKDVSNNTVSAENVAKIKVVSVDVVDIADSIAKPKVSVILNYDGQVLLRKAPVKSLGEWKWATSIVGPFVSFNPVQTDSVLRMTAANLGSIFVVYETTVNNDDATPVVVYSSPVEVEVIEDVGVAPLANNAAIVYPTITSGAFTIKNVGSGKVSVQVIDVTGKVVLNKKYDQSGTIQLNYPVKGSYIVKVVSAKGVKVSHLVVK